LFIPGLLAGYIAWKYIRRQSLLHQLTAARITPQEVKEKLEAHEDLLVLDIRNTLELEMDPQTIPGAFHLPLERLARDGENLPRDREIILYCT
jgi:rhodanese-related sulfurtransferase